MMRAIRSKITSIALVLIMLLTLIPLSGCSDSVWVGDWNRTGDATYNRGELNITEYTREAITFTLTVYNGNIAGQLVNEKAEFVNNEKTEARYYVPDGYGAYIQFLMDESETFMDVIYTSSMYTEMEVMGFAEGGFITGRYDKGEVEYLNDSLYSMGVIEKSYDDQLRDMMPEGYYTRLLDCYQSFTVKRNNEIGGFIYYGSNSMQTHTAALICFDDGSVSVVISREKESMLYYTNNRIYDKSMLAYPLDNWIDEYELEKEKQNQTIVLP